MQMSTPFPLPSREYLIQRKLCQLPPLVAGGPRPFLKIDRLLEGSAAEMQVEAPRAVARHCSLQLLSVVG